MSETFSPNWRKTVPADKSYRSVFKYDPKAFKHPSQSWFEMFKSEFAMTDDDFKIPTRSGDEAVTVQAAPVLDPAHLDALRKIVENGGSISHHHGVRKTLAPWLKQYLGDEQLAVLGALKQHFDPKNLMNPGVLVGPRNSETTSG